MASLNSIFKLPTRVAYTSGVGDNDTPLIAFDKALQDAGINDTNLIPVSSTVPPTAKQVDIDFIRERLNPGSTVQVVLSRSESSVPGEKVVACVSGCRLKHPEPSHRYNPGFGFGINVEYHNKGSPDNPVLEKNHVKEYCENMLREMANRRGAAIRSEITHAYGEHVVKNNGCAVAALVYLSDD